MSLESYNLKIVLILTIGFTLASILGYISQRAKLSPILGYLLAGYLIGPYSPGFEADMELSEQLAEIGVILMLFGVGLHFKWEDLVSVRNIAIPGAIVQTLVSSIVGTILIWSIGWPIEAGIIIGLAIGVASTVVLVRVLSDHNLINTPQGHIAIGWLVVEDILTVLVLILLPSLASSFSGQTGFSFQQIGISIAFSLLKFLLLAVIMFTLGRKLVTKVFFSIARTRSHELFTLTVLALTFLIATSSALVFGTSIALGAFIAGMVIGQTDVKHQASANALPIRDAFSVIFFLSVGMLFSPNAIIQQFPLFIGILTIILIIKPLAAFLIVLAFGFPLGTGLIIAVALAQIGEFSFILAEEALRLNIFPEAGYDIIVACALVSISINPLLFKFIEPLQSYLDRKFGSLSVKKAIIKDLENLSPKAIVVGFGPIGQSVTQTLEDMGFKTTVIDRNLDTMTKLIEENRGAIYGDATHSDILKSAEIDITSLLIITIPDITVIVSIVSIARQINSKIRILARCKYLSDQPILNQLNVKWICCEKEEIRAFNYALSHLTTDLYSKFIPAKS